jgi:hypothetical protein
MDETPTPNQYETCEQCGSPVDANQRYCVVCGSRRKHVVDPALRHLASAGARPRGAAKGGRPDGRTRRSAGLGTALVIAVIPVAVALGLLIGRSDNGSNAKVLAALRAAKAPVVNVTAGNGSASTLASTNTTSSSKGSKQHKKSSSSGTNSGKKLSTTKYGSFNSVASIKAPTQAQQNQGAAVVQHDQSNTGGNYINSQKGLPNVVSVP